MDKWIMFKNYMHNELGITKEDIRQWIKEAVEEQAKEMVANTYGQYGLREVIKSAVTDTDIYGINIKHDIKIEAGRILAEELLKENSIKSNS